MRFTNLITAVMAVLLPITTFAAPVETQIHLHTRCEAYQVGFKKCLGVREIVQCAWFNGNFYWIRDRTCPTQSICTETAPYEPYCEILIFDCRYGCKMVNGTVTDLAGNKAQLVDGAKDSAKGMEGLEDVQDSKQGAKYGVLADDSLTDDAPLEYSEPKERSLTADAALNPDKSPENSVIAADSTELEPRSDRPCRSWEWSLRKCIGAVSIFICEERANGYYWTLSQHCLVGQRCNEPDPYQPFCQGYVFDCVPLCKIVNGTVTDAQGTKANLIDPSKKDSEEAN